MSYAPERNANQKRNQDSSPIFEGKTRLTWEHRSCRRIQRYNGGTGVWLVHRGSLKHIRTLNVTNAVLHVVMTATEGLLPSTVKSRLGSRSYTTTLSGCKVAFKAKKNDQFKIKAAI